MRCDLPSGTVTFLFTDIEGSTKLLQELGTVRYTEALLEHRRVLREAFARHGGVEVGTEGDSFFVVFPTAPGALAAAAEAQEALAQGSIRVRMGMHTGTAHLAGEDYVGEDVHKTARIAAAGHGGQVLVSKETRQLVEVELTDLGEHRLRDFQQLVGIFQLGSDRFPPLRTISNTNLPRPASSFVGREREIAEVVSLLRDRARLLTLTGPGGSGKTRLAIEAAAELVPEFKAGVFWVGLAPLRDPALVTDTIAKTLGAKDGLADHIGEQDLLLLLDNLEQVIEAAPELSVLVEACPNVKLLVTSRELLRVRGEVEYPVLPLADPEAIKLFCTRAGTDQDETVAELCRALDNLPLAIELAAARTSVLSPAQILDRLSGRLDLLRGGRDADPRQQTLRATIEWSHELLSSREQALFARLAVFRGGCTLEAAQEAADADLDTLQSLMDKNLLRRRENRFFMLETIREYAAERLEASREHEVWWRRHAAWFLGLAEEAYPNLGGSPKEWLDRLEEEHDNLRGAFDRLIDLGETQLPLQLAGALWRFWYLRGPFLEGRQWLERALEGDPTTTGARARALNGATALSLEHRDAATARRRAEEALAIYRSLGDEWGTALSEFLLAQVVVEEGDYARARQMLEESVSRFRQLGDEHHALLATRTLAWMYEELGDFERFRTLHDESLRRARATGNQRIEARSLCALAMIAIDEGRVAEALPMLKEAYRIDCEVGETYEVAVELSRFARAMIVAGRPETAARLLSRAEAVREEIGATFESWTLRMNEETLTAIGAQLNEAAFGEAWEQGRALTTDEAVTVALDSSY